MEQVLDLLYVLLGRHGLGTIDPLFALLHSDLSHCYLLLVPFFLFYNLFEMSHPLIVVEALHLGHGASDQPTVVVLNEGHRERLPFDHRLCLGDYDGLVVPCAFLSTLGLNGVGS